ncbi:putative receptor protein, partial [Stigmatella aurantiaca DW4/3-1]
AAGFAGGGGGAGRDGGVWAAERAGAAGREGTVATERVVGRATGGRETGTRPGSTSPMSTRPRKLAPSTMMTRGERMSPTMRPSRVSSTLSVALMLPTTTPLMMALRTATLAFTTPVVSTMRVLLSVSSPSTRPRTVRSSSPVSLPLMRMEGPTTVLSPDAPVRSFAVATRHRSFWSMSTLPLKEAPSAMRMRGALMSPTTRQSVFNSTLSLATMLPVTRPAISTFCVSMSASTTPLPST